MKAPDKIYVDKFGQAIEGYIPEGCSLVTEYIRKDALLELINKKLQESADRLDYRTNKVYAEILDKLNEM